MPDIRGTIAGHLSRLGYSPVHSAGILGALQTESNLNPTAIGDNGTSYGLAQWHNDRWNGLKRHAAGMGLDPSDVGAQVSYLDWELKNKEPLAYKSLMAAQDPRAAATAMLHFERPQGYTPDNPLGGMHSDKRIANAVNAYAALTGGQITPADAAPQQVAAAPQGLLGGQPGQADQPDPATDAAIKGLLSQSAQAQAQDEAMPSPGLLRRQTPKFALAKMRLTV